MTTLGPYVQRPNRRILSVLALAAIAAAALAAGSTTLTRTAISPSAGSIPDNGITVRAYEPRILAAQTIIVVHEQNLGARSVVSIIDQRSGRVLGVIDAADGPLVLARPSRNELLLSDVYDGGDQQGPSPRLLTFDLANGLQRKQGALPMPDRAMYPIYTPSMMLSKDERYLYYMKRRDCGFLCNEVSVGVVDLDTRAELVASLPTNCGHVLFTRDGGDGAVAMCPILGSLWRLEPSAAARLLSDGFSGTGLYAGVASGNAYWITMEGQLTVKDPASGRVLLQKEVLPAGTGALTGIYRWEADGEVILGVKRDRTAEEIASLLSIDVTTWTASSQSVPRGTTHVAALTDGRLAAVHEGRISVIAPRAGGRVEADYTAPPGVAPWLVAP